MMHIIMIPVLSLFTAQLHANEVSGTLTLEGKYCVFRLTGVEEKYEALKMPGLKVIDYTPKVAVKNEEETDVSELVLVLPSGEKITLISARPFAIFRTKSDAVVSWRVPQK